MLLGLATQGLYSDILGRKEMLKYSILGTYLAISAHAIVQTYVQTLIVRFSFGFLFGISLPLSLIIISE